MFDYVTDYTAHRAAQTPGTLSYHLKNNTFHQTDIGKRLKNADSCKEVYYTGIEMGGVISGENIINENSSKTDFSVNFGRGFKQGLENIGHYNCPVNGELIATNSLKNGRENIRYGFKHGYEYGKSKGTNNGVLYTIIIIIAILFFIYAFVELYDNDYISFLIFILIGFIILGVAFL